MKTHLQTGIQLATLVAVLLIGALWQVEAADRRATDKRPIVKRHAKYDDVAAGYAANRPLAWWPLGEMADDKTAADASGKHEGKLVNGAPDFNGSTARVEVGTLDIDSPQMTILAWFNADDFGTPDARIISKTTGNKKDEHYWMLGTVKKDDSFRLRFRLKAGGSTDDLTARNEKLNAGEWIFAAAVFNGKAMTLYQNGKVVGRMKKKGRVDANAHAHVWIGDNPSGPASWPFDGKIENVALFDRALSGKVIQAIYAAQGQEPVELTEVDEPTPAPTEPDVRSEAPKPPHVDLAQVASDRLEDESPASAEDLPTPSDESAPKDADDTTVAKAELPEREDENDVPPPPKKEGDVIEEPPSPSDVAPANTTPPPSDQPAYMIPPAEGSIVMNPETIIIGEGDSGGVIWASGASFAMPYGDHIVVEGHSSSFDCPPSFHEVPWCEPICPQQHYCPSEATFDFATPEFP